MWRCFAASTSAASERCRCQSCARVFESQGLADVSTYIQSGNVLFKADGRVSTVNLESAIADRFGIDVDVILRTSTDLYRIVTESPLATRDPKLVHVGFMAKAPDPTSLGQATWRATTRGYWRATAPSNGSATATGMPPPTTPGSRRRNATHADTWPSCWPTRTAWPGHGP